MQRGNGGGRVYVVPTIPGPRDIIAAVKAWRPSKRTGSLLGMWAFGLVVALLASGFVTSPEKAEMYESEVSAADRRAGPAA